MDQGKLHSSVQTSREKAGFTLRLTPAVPGTFLPATLGMMHLRATKSSLWVQYRSTDGWTLTAPWSTRHMKKTWLFPPGIHDFRGLAHPIFVLSKCQQMFDGRSSHVGPTEIAGEYATRCDVSTLIIFFLQSLQIFFADDSLIELLLVCDFHLTKGWLQNVERSKLDRKLKLRLNMAGYLPVSVGTY